MKIDLSRDEYIRLLELTEIALWVIEAHHEEERSHTRPYRDLEQKLFATAEAMGCGELVDYEEELQRFFPSMEFEEALAGTNFIGEFEDNTFWDQLILRLAERDMIRQVGEQSLQEMIPEERAEVEQPHADRYFKEFQKNGLENVTLRS